jgi:glycosyltransferase involved in cell wall biosynthesis
MEGLRMEVVVDARLALPHMTGIGRYLSGLARGMSRLGGEDAFEFWIQPSLAADHPIRAHASGNVSVEEVRIRHMSLRQQWAVPALLRRRLPELLHYPHFDPPFAARTPMVVTIHDLIYIRERSHFAHLGRAKRLVMWAMMILAVRRAERVVAVSESTRRDMVHLLKAQPEKVAVVPEGVEDRYFQAVPSGRLDEVRERHGLGSRFLLFVGERRPHKNIVGLLRAFQLFREMGYLDHQLVIIGKRYADHDEPERLIRELPPGQVRLVGYVSDEDLRAFYCAADAFVLLSFYEGFGLPVLEAMASGTPVVASQRGSLPEVVGHAGLLVEPDDPAAAALALSRVVSGGPEREERIEQGLGWARRFTWESSARRTVEVYRTAVGG